MSDENTTEPVDYAAMYDAGQAPDEPVDIPEAVPTEDEPPVEIEEVPVLEEPVVEEVVTEELVSEEPVVEEFVSEELVVDEPIVALDDIYGKKFKVDIPEGMKLNLRSKADGKSDVITKLDLGDAVTALNVADADPEYLFVQVDATAETGYLKKLYVTEA